MIRKIAYLLTIVLVFSCINAFATDSKKELDAISAAEKWLSMVDSKKYTESWEKAAELLRRNADATAAVGAINAGGAGASWKLVSRNVKTKTYMTSLPGAPDGEYVVIQFETSF